MEHKIEGVQYKNEEMSDFSLNIMQIQFTDKSPEEHAGNSLHERDITVSGYIPENPQNLPRKNDRVK